MKDEFWEFMDSARGFWFGMATLVILGFAYMFGSKEVIDRIMEKRRQRDVDSN